MKKRSGSAGHAFHQLLQQLGDDPNAFEFQLPDWLKKQKSMPYTFIRRSILPYI